MQKITEKLNRLFRLAFEDRQLESRYQKKFFRDHLPQNLLAAKVAIILYLIYVPAIYAITGNEGWLLVWISAASLSGSVFLLYARNTGLLYRNRDLILFAAAVMVGIGPVLYYIVTGNDRSLIRIDIILPVIGIFTMYGIGFSLALTIVLTIALIGGVTAYWTGLDTFSVLSAAYVFVSASIISGVAGYFIERTDRRLFTARLESDAFRFMVENAMDAICVFDPDTFTYVYANRKAREINGSPNGTILGKSLKEVHAEITVEKMNRILEAISREGTYSDIFKIFDYTNHVYFYARIAFQTALFNGKKALIAFSSDATRQKEKENTFRKQAQHDSLTGLYNRYRFDERIREEVAIHKGRKSPLSLVICDIDHFKRINDTFGHLTGDRVLIQISQLLLHTIRKNDIIARWGGEEFAILLNDTNEEDAVKVAEHLRNTLALKRFERVGNVYASFGVAEFDGNESLETWFNRTDRALYLAKSEGRNKVRAA